MRLREQALILSISLAHTIISFGLALTLEKGNPKELIYLQNWRQTNETTRTLKLFLTSLQNFVSGQTRQGDWAKGISKRKWSRHKAHQDISKEKEAVGKGEGRNCAISSCGKLSRNQANVSSISVRLVEPRFRSSLWSAVDLIGQSKFSMCACVCLQVHCLCLGICLLYARLWLLCTNWKSSTLRPQTSHIPHSTIHISHSTQCALRIYINSILE